MFGKMVRQESDEHDCKSPADAPNPEKLKLDFRTPEVERRAMERQAQAAGSHYAISALA